MVAPVEWLALSFRCRGVFVCVYRGSMLGVCVAVIWGLRPVCGCYVRIALDFDFGALGMFILLDFFERVVLLGCCCFLVNKCGHVQVAWPGF
jgi:hypothetical protein